MWVWWRPELHQAGGTAPPRGAGQGGTPDVQGGGHSRRAGGHVVGRECGLALHEPSGGKLETPPRRAPRSGAAEGWIRGGGTSSESPATSQEPALQVLATLQGSCSARTRAERRTTSTGEGRSRALRRVWVCRHTRCGDWCKVFFQRIGDQDHAMRVMSDCFVSWFLGIFFLVSLKEGLCFESSRIVGNSGFMLFDLWWFWLIENWFPAMNSFAMITTCCRSASELMKFVPRHLSSFVQNNRKNIGRARRSEISVVFHLSKDFTPCP